jgi:hypothetical protein
LAADGQLVIFDIERQEMQPGLRRTGFLMLLEG